MNDNWKPGDVAMVNGHVAFVWDDEMFVYTDSDGDAVSTWLVGSDARRLVVIDPDDREQVERLWSMTYDGSADYLQAALREFANPTPPKPEEPTGLGAVVEDANGNRWVQTMRDGTYGAWCKSGGGDFFRGWSEITAVRVLSEGVTP